MSGKPPSNDGGPPSKKSWTDKAKGTFSFNKSKKEKKDKQSQETAETSVPGSLSGSGPSATSSSGIPGPPVGPLSGSQRASGTGIPKPPTTSPTGIPGPSAASRTGLSQTSGAPATSRTGRPQQSAAGSPTTSTSSSPQGRGQQKSGTPPARGQQTSPQGRGQQTAGTPQGRGQPSVGTRASPRSGAPQPERQPSVPPGSGTSTSPSPRTWMRNGIVAETRLSTVFLCTNLQNNKKFIAKTVLAHELEPRTAIEIERRMYKGYKPIHSPFFIQHLGFNIEEKCVEMDNHDVCNMFLEWVPRGSLSQYIRTQKEPLKESLIATFCRDILKALVYLHGQGKIHGDIKASNILVGNECLRLCDLGSGKVMSDGDVLIPPKKGRNPLDRRIYTTGSDGYRAPEVEDEVEQGPPADIYAVGCTLVEMATGDPPERCPRIFRSRDEIDPKTGYPVYTIDLPAEFSKAAFEFLELCLAANPRHRPSADALLGHRWFTETVLHYPFGNRKNAPQAVQQ